MCSIDGKPHLTYQDAHQTLSFTGDEIRTLNSEIGGLVSVRIWRTIDTGSTSFSLLVPHVNLGHATSVPIATEGIITLPRFSVVLTGTANLVEF